MCKHVPNVAVVSSVVSVPDDDSIPVLASVISVCVVTSCVVVGASDVVPSASSVPVTGSTNHAPLAWDRGGQESRTSNRHTGGEQRVKGFMPHPLFLLALDQNLEVSKLSLIHISEPTRRA